MHDRVDEGTFAAPDRERHLYGRDRQIGIVMFPDGEPDDAPGPHVQHAVEEQLALISDDFSAVAVPLVVEPIGAEITLDQVLGSPPAATLAGGLPAVSAATRDQPQLGHQLRHRVLTDPPALLAQVVGDPRRPVGPVMFGEQTPDRDLQLLTPGMLGRRVAVAPLVEPRLGDSQSSTRGRMRDAVLGPFWAAI